MDTQSNIVLLTDTSDIFDRFAAKHGLHCVIFDDGQRQSICLAGERGHRRLLNYSRNGLVGITFEDADDCAARALIDTSPIF
jgi:CRP-like cAMP-binding protein